MDALRLQSLHHVLLMLREHLILRDGRSHLVLVLTSVRVSTIVAWRGLQIALIPCVLPVISGSGLDGDMRGLLVEVSLMRRDDPFCLFDLAEHFPYVVCVRII